MGWLRFGETTTVSIQAVWTQSVSNICWVLKPIERNSQWLKWLEACERRRTHLVTLVLPAVKDGIAVMDSSEADYLPDSVDNVSPHGNEAPGSGYVAHNRGYDEGQSSNSQS